MPDRIQLSRRKGYRKPTGAVVVARPSRWGNPHRVTKCYRTECGASAAQQFRWCVTCADALTHEASFPSYRQAAQWAVDNYAIRFWTEPGLDERARDTLAGHDLACWCPLVDERGNRMPCHADVLLAISNGWEL